MNNLRIGLGYDCHLLKNEGSCIIGGLKINSELAPQGHSDGDVLLHAICDALLGAAGLDDLGTQFKDSEPKWKNKNSTFFLEETIKQLNNLNLKCIYIDCVLICDEPKISPYRESIRQNLSQSLKLDISRINLKGKTTEVGDKTKIEAHVVALITSA